MFWVALSWFGLGFAVAFVSTWVLLFVLVGHHLERVAAKTGELRIVLRPDTDDDEGER